MRILLACLLAAATAAHAQSPTEVLPTVTTEIKRDGGVLPYAQINSLLTKLRQHGEGLFRMDFRVDTDKTKRPLPEIRMVVRSDEADHPIKLDAEGRFDLPLLPEAEAKTADLATNVAKGQMAVRGTIELTLAPAELDLAKVRRMVLVPPSWEGDRNDLALEAARSYPDRFAVMGRLTLGDPKSRDLVADWKKQPGMLGMRFTFHSEHYRHLLTDGSADWLWPAAERYGIPLMVLMPGALDRLDTIAARHPGLKLVIDHVGLDIRAKAPKVWEDLPRVCALAKHPLTLQDARFFL